MAEFVVTTDDPEWVRYEWRVDAVDRESALAAVRAGHVTSVTRVGHYVDVDGLDRAVVSVEQVPDGWSRGTP